MKSYSVVEMFSTLQGEGYLAGRRAVFMRFTGCNMWNGNPDDRDKGVGACARWCDTFFASGQKLTAEEILVCLDAEWGSNPVGNTDADCRMVVITGGEPTLQLDVPLVDALHKAGWFVAIETNGTNKVEALAHVDHVCVSPKRGGILQVQEADELKVVLPGGEPGSPPEENWTDDDLRDMVGLGRFQHLYVQPQDATIKTATEQTHLHMLRSGQRDITLELQYDANVQECLRFIKANPSWRLSLQQHKFIGIR